VRLGVLETRTTDGTAFPALAPRGGGPRSERRLRPEWPIASPSRQQVFPLGELVTTPDGDWDFLILLLVLQISFWIL
jgi:hypothetical protein